MTWPRTARPGPRWPGSANGWPMTWTHRARWRLWITGPPQFCLNGRPSEPADRADGHLVRDAIDALLGVAL